MWGRVNIVGHGGMKVLLKLWEILVKELIFNKISALHTSNAIKIKLL